MEKKGRILLLHQLFHRKHYTEKEVVVSDHSWLTDEKPFNKITLVHRFICASAYAKKHNLPRFWKADSPGKDPFVLACKYLKKRGIHTIHMFDPIDKPLVQQVTRTIQRLGMKLVLEDTPAFSETKDDLQSFVKENPPTKRKGINSYSHTTFYRWQRKRLNLLMTKNGKYVGGKLTYDIENRKAFPKTLRKDPTIVKSLPLPLPSGEVNRIREYVATHYKHNPGSLPTDSHSSIGSASVYPMTHEQAITRLKTFLKKLLPKFGPYEDAIREDILFGYHSVLSSSLNNGLLTPEDILLELRKRKGVPSGEALASIEGFVRQIFGWRSYARLIYERERETMMRSNYLKHSNKLPKSWYKDDITKIDTGIEWLNTMFHSAYKHAYAHHIVRLMVFSQWFLLMRIHPRDVLDWFWSVVSIDAYEWVMVPNVLGMGQYADGGIMMTRAYVSSSAYLTKMSSNTLHGKVVLQKKEYTWDTIWKALYYDFLIKHRKKFEKQYAYASMYSYISRVSKTERQEWKRLASKYRKYI